MTYRLGFIFWVHTRLATCREITKHKQSVAWIALVWIDPKETWINNKKLLL